MQDRVIGDIFSHPTEGKLKVVAEGAVNECYGCVFNGPNHCSNDPTRVHTGECAMELRLDGQGVIFVKEEGGKNV